MDCSKLRLKIEKTGHSSSPWRVIDQQSGQTLSCWEPFDMKGDRPSQDRKTLVQTPLAANTKAGLIDRLLLLLGNLLSRPHVQARKYWVSKADGSAIDPDAKYFVIRYDAQAEHGAVGRSALLNYCQSLNQSGKCPELVEDLLADVYQEGTKHD